MRLTPGVTFLSNEPPTCRRVCSFIPSRARHMLAPALQMQSIRLIHSLTVFSKGKRVWVLYCIDVRCLSNSSPAVCHSFSEVGLVSTSNTSSIFSPKRDKVERQIDANIVKRFKVFVRGETISLFVLEGRKHPAGLFWGRVHILLRLFFFFFLFWTNHTHKGSCGESLPLFLIHSSVVSVLSTRSETEGEECRETATQ